MTKELDPVEQEIAFTRQKLLEKGSDSFTDLDWAFLRTYWLGLRLNGLTNAIEAHIKSPKDGNGRHITRKQAAMNITIPGVTGAGLLAVLLEILRAIP